MTVKHPLEQKLDRRLNRITWISVSLVVAVFLVAFWFVLYDEQKKGVAAEEAFLAQVMRVQEKAIEQEIFLNLEEAVKLRLDGVVTNDRLEAAHMRACVRVVPVKNPETATIVSCSNPHDAARFDDARHPFTELALSIGVEPMAKLQYFLVKDRSWRDFIPPKLLFSILLAIVGAFFLHRHAVRRLQENVIAPLLKNIAENERSSAIAETVQMVAHDVRKPFLAVRAAMDSLRLAKNQADYDAMRTKYMPDIERSVTAVNALLADVLEMGSKRNHAPEEASFTEAMVAAFQTLMPVSSSRHIHVAFDFYHQHKVRAEAKHVSRIVSNLVENAFQAVNDGGEIWFKSREFDASGTRFIEFTIGNTGSFIEPENLLRVFEPFVTTKKTGYGLGLAIASKFVRDYGGMIWASSAHDIGTQFYFTLPAGTEMDLHVGADCFTLGPDVDSDSTGNAPVEVNPASSVLLFDDEESIRQAWSLLAVQNGLKNLKPFSSWEDFSAKNAFDLAVGATAFVDIHFRGSRYSGLEIASNLRKLGVRRIYAVTADPQVAIGSGLFDGVLGKSFPDALTRAS
jgi:signal transduction histidine kinase